MKKFTIFSIISILVFSSCSLFRDVEEPEEEALESSAETNVGVTIIDRSEDQDAEGEEDDDEETEEDSTESKISPEMIEKFDLTEEEAKELEEMGISDDNIELWIDEQKAMGPGPFDFNTDLEDVSGGNATGYAGAYFAEGEYHVFAQFENLPHPEEGYFYEGWVVRKSPLSVLSTGEAVRSLGDYHNTFRSAQDLTDHDFYVLTLEPDDGDPEPAEHILEGTMK